MEKPLCLVNHCLHAINGIEAKKHISEKNSWIFPFDQLTIAEGP